MRLKNADLGTMTRNRLLLVLAAIICVALLRVKGGSELTSEDARKYLADGAVLVDVRTAEEFASESLSGAVNIPLDTLKSGIENHVTDKSQVVLLHCRSGRRSGLAEEQLRAMGYTNAFNIGGYDEAARIVSPPASD